MLSFSSQLTEIKGIGPNIALKLAKLKLHTVKDVLYYFPFRYLDFSKISKIADLEEGQVATIYGKIDKVSIYKTFHKKMWIVEATISDETGKVKAVWFNQKFLINTLKEGTFANFAGKPILQGKHLTFQNPMFEMINDEFQEARHTGRLVPVYPQTEGVTSKMIRYVVSKILPDFADSVEFLPENVVKEFDFPSLSDSFAHIHYPDTIEQAQEAEKRFSFQDLFLLQLINASEREHLSKQDAYACDYTPEYIKELFLYVPFELTLAQKKALHEILEDLKKPHPTSRLLQGDVGSGKTIVAAIASLVVANNGKQTVLMAPTEVLARQHYETFKKYFEEFSDGIALLTSAQALSFYGDGLETETSKKELVSQIKSGKIKIIIGTHSVIQRGVEFKNPALVVIDEQHRFGVNQRALLVHGSPQIKTQINADVKIKKPDLVYAELTYKIRGALFNIYNQLGPGHKEVIYHKALLEELQIKSINSDNEKLIPVKYNNKKVGAYKPDIVVDNKIIIELKALPFIGNIEKKQVWNYLKGSEYKLALLVNFGNKNLDIQRIVYDKNYENPSKSEFNQSKSELVLPHLLSMSATPIPRTLAMTAFGDLDLSIINELPKNRKPIITKAITAVNRQKAYDFVTQQIKLGRQAFVICPRIEPPDPEAPLTSRQLFNLEVKSVKEETEKLSKKIFPDFKIASLHGKMKSAEKQKIMQDFKDKKFDILVSTSVIEVGIDIPNATVMLIEGSEYFGLSQLYQFRGRVGRGEHQSYCFLFSDINSKSTAIRMKALVNAKNGFELAEIDLKLRGPGQFLGQEQSGLPDLAMKAIQNPQLVQATRDSAYEIIKSDPELKNHPYLATYVKMFAEQVHLE
jgi:ATP-dependent DNA helicase RecG